MVCIEHFIQGWDFVQTLGEGAYGEVKLATNSKHENIAVKTIHLEIFDNTREIDTFVKKEIAIHKALKCRNIIRYLGMRRGLKKIYLFLEYVSGGELFDRIEPDVGVPHTQARFYYTQLLTGIEYIHSKGITHRDIKPENILFDSQDVLKICDFGLATMYRFQGKERKLTRRCGTICYVAPEVMYLPYNAQPAELWSSGVVLFTLLFGQLPWDEPTNRDANFGIWVKGNYTQSHIWGSLSNDVLSIFQGILSIDPNSRLKLEEIKQLSWFKNNFASSSIKHGSSNCDSKSPNIFPSTQPTAVLTPEHDPGLLFQRGVFLSQPLDFDEIYLGTQLVTQTQYPAQYSMPPSLTKRLTRIFLKSDLQSAISTLNKILSGLKIDSRLTSDHANACIRVLTIDYKGRPMQFNMLLYSLEEFTIMVDFRRTKGDALEFKRKFKLIEGAVNSPCTWTKQE